MDFDLAAEKAIGELQRQIEDTDDPEERRELAQEIREIGRKAADYEQWSLEGRTNGWL